MVDRYDVETSVTCLQHKARVCTMAMLCTNNDFVKQDLKIHCD